MSQQAEIGKAAECCPEAAGDNSLEEPLEPLVLIDVPFGDCQIVYNFVVELQISWRQHHGYLDILERLEDGSRDYSCYGPHKPVGCFRVHVNVRRRLNTIDNSH